MRLMCKQRSNVRAARGALSTLALLLAALWLAPAAFAIAPLHVDEDAAKEKQEPKITLSAAEGMPLPDALFKRYIEAMGGEEAILGQKSMRAGGTWGMPAMGINGRFRIYAAAPSKMLMVLQAPGIGEMRTGFNGEVGWTTGELVGTMLMEEQELADMKIDADFYYPVTYRNHFKELRTVEKTEFTDQSCYHVRGKRRTGDEVSIYFNRETGMMVGTSGVRTSEHGAINMVVIFQDFEDVNGIIMPKRMILRMPDMGIEQIFHTTEVSQEEIDEATFDVPDPVKRMIERREAAAQRDAEDE